MKAAEDRTSLGAEVEALRIDLELLLEEVERLAQARHDAWRTLDRSYPELVSLYGRIQKKRAEIEHLSHPRPYEAGAYVLECLANRDAADFERRP